jgi:hypothetical protein
METTEEITVLTREDLQARGWTARQIRKQRPDTIIRTKRRGRPKFGHSLSNVLAVEAAIAEAKAVVAEARGVAAETVTLIVAVA